MDFSSYILILSLKVSWSISFPLNELKEMWLTQLLKITFNPVFKTKMYQQIWKIGTSYSDVILNGKIIIISHFPKDLNFVMQITIHRYWWIYGKDGLARSPYLVSRQKNRIFDLDWLREVESKKLLTKSWRTNRNLNIFKSEVFPFDDPK